MAIVLDVETVAADGIEYEPISAPAHYKDPEKIAAYIADGERTQRERAALHPWTTRVVCLGWIDNDGLETASVCRDESAEAAALEAFWRSVMHADDRFVRPILGFNHRQYDLPVLLARSLLLNVPAPNINLDRYRTPHIDLMDRLTWFGAVPSRSLHWYCRRFGLAVDDAVKGRDIAALVAAGDWDAVEAHNRSDVRLTLALAERLGLVRSRRATA